MMYEVHGTSLPTAYHRALQYLDRFGKVVDCPDWNTRCKDMSMTISVVSPLSEPRISKLFPGGPFDLEQYRQEMLDGILDFEVKAGKWAYTYHQRIAEQLPMVIAELKRDPDSRRAVITVLRPDDILGSDPPCLNWIQFRIDVVRGSLRSFLNMTTVFRSNDAVKATFMNMYALICLQEKVAKELGCMVGTYTHIASSFHCYERDWDTLKGYIKRLDAAKYCDDEGLTTYWYKGNWDELMEEAKPAIEQKVQDLMERA